MYYYCSPPFLLEPYVDRFWFYEGQTLHHHKERVLPHGAIELLMNLHADEIRVYDCVHHDHFQRLRGSVFSGAHSRFSVIDTAEQSAIMGVHFKSGGVAPFLALPASELHNQHISLYSLWGSAADQLYEQLCAATSVQCRFHVLAEALIARLYNARHCSQHPAIDFAVQAFTQVPHMQTIQDITKQIGLSQRRFIQIFHDAVGLTPKLFCRIQRFQALLQYLEYGQPVRWAEVALDCGYYDQAHFIHDFQAFSGLSPSTYLASRSTFHNHVPIPC